MLKYFMQNTINNPLSNFDKTFEDEFYKYAKSLEFKKGTSPFYSDDLLKHFYIIMDGRIWMGY